MNFQCRLISRDIGNLKIQAEERWHLLFQVPCTMRNVFRNDSNRMYKVGYLGNNEFSDKRVLLLLYSEFIISVFLDPSLPHSMYS